MAQTFVVDQTATFEDGVVAFISCKPREVFGEPGRQDVDKATGHGKWVVEVTGGFVDNFGRVTNEVIKVGIVSSSNPAEGLRKYTPITLVRLEVGVMEKTAGQGDERQSVPGFHVWYRCQSMRPLDAIPAPSPRRAAVES